MTAREFLGDRLRPFILWFFAASLTIIFLRLTGTQSSVLWIVLILWLLFFGIVHTVDFLKCRAYLSELDSVMENLDQKYLFTECMPKPKGIYEKKLFYLLKKSGKSMIESVSAAQSSQREYREYIESWVHEIKTPITAAKLLCGSLDASLRRRFTQELSQIDNHVEKTLFYARAESPEKDFLIRQTGLLSVVTEAIASHQSLLMQNGIRITTKDLDYIVYTDSKWVTFLLGQLLQNAVKYRSNAPSITISAEKFGRQVALTIHDNGMGIPPHELQRIFERGFTGSNGRARGGATGIGLYLCRLLSDFLGISLTADSREGEGTSLILLFPAKENLTKM